MNIIKILLAVLGAILKGAVAAFLAVASLGLAWLLGIGALALVVVAGVSGFGVAAERRKKKQP